MLCGWDLVCGALCLNKDGADIRAWEAGRMGIDCLAFQMWKRGGATCLKVLRQLGAELDSCTVWGVLMECVPW